MHRRTRPADLPLARLPLACLPLLLWGCGEPPGASAPGTPSPPGPISAPSTDSAPGSPPLVGAAPTPASPPGTDAGPASPPGPDPDPAAGPPPDGTVAAASPPPVDCAATLPCRLTSADGALALALHAADGEALDGSGPLRVDLTLEALSRDAEVALQPSSSVIAGGQVLAVDALRLGLPSAPGARDEASFPLIAGVPINGHATFAGELVGNPPTLDRVTLHLAEAGRRAALTFANVPLGPARSDPVDCAGALPCEWRPADGGATLVLGEAAPLRWNRATRLAVSFTLAAERPLELAMLPAGGVTGADGATLEPYGIELDGEESRDGTVLARSLEAGASVGGRLVPRRMPEADQVPLARVALPLVERRSPRTPRWQPVFLNVPVSLPPPEG